MGFKRGNKLGGRRKASARAPAARKAAGAAPAASDAPPVASAAPAAAPAPAPKAKALTAAERKTLAEARHDSVDRTELIELITSANSHRELRACTTAIEVALLKREMTADLAKVLLACEGRRRQALDKELARPQEAGSEARRLITPTEWALVLDHRRANAARASSAPPEPIDAPDAEEAA